MDQGDTVDHTCVLPIAHTPRAPLEQLLRHNIPSIQSDTLALLFTYNPLKLRMSSLSHVR